MISVGRRTLGLIRGISPQGQILRVVPNVYPHIIMIANDYG
jgi:hypothetical protein